MLTLGLRILMQFNRLTSFLFAVSTNSSCSSSFDFSRRIASSCLKRCHQEHAMIGKVIGQFEQIFSKMTFIKITPILQNQSLKNYVEVSKEFLILIFVWDINIFAA